MCERESTGVDSFLVDALVEKILINWMIREGQVERGSGAEEIIVRQTAWEGAYPSFCRSPLSDE